MSAGSFACDAIFAPVPELGVQGVVRVDLGFRGDIWPARDVGCSDLFFLIFYVALSTTDRFITLDLPINRSTGTQPLAADEIVCGSYKFSSGIFSVRYPRLAKGSLGLWS